MLGALLHIGVQTFFVLVLIAVAGLDPLRALAIVASYVGVTQLTYMVPAIVDASVLRSRRLTARGLLMIAMATMGANLLVLRVFAPAWL